MVSRIIVTASAVAYSVLGWRFREAWPGPAPVDAWWFWPPLVATAAALGVAGLLGLWAGRKPGGSEPPGAEGRSSGDCSAEVRSGGAGRAWLALDALAILAVLAAGFVLQARWTAWANPASVSMGVDHVSFTANVVAWCTGAWFEFNTDKPVGYAATSGLAARALGDYVRGALLVSRVSGALLPVLAWAVARPLYGRWPAFVVALLVLGDAETWVYAAQTTNSALYIALATATLAAFAWYARAPSFVLAVVSGTLAGLAFETSEKAFVTLIPVFVMLSLGLLAVARRRGMRRAAELFRVTVMGLAAWGAVWLVHPPVAYTPLGNLIGNKRAEVYLQDPYVWPALKHPNPWRPVAGYEFIPVWLRSPRVMVTLSVLTTPNDSNVLRLPPSGRGRVVEVPGTSLPPWRRNVARNWAELSLSRMLTPVRVALVLVGVLASLLRARSTPALALSLAFLSAVAALTLKYEDRYVVHLLPLAWVLTAGGLDTLARGLAGRSALGAAVGRAAIGVLTLLLLATTIRKDAGAFQRPLAGAWPPPAANLSGTSGDIGGAGANIRALATWIAENRPSGTLHDCSRDALRGYLPPGWPATDPGRDPLCAQPADAPAGTLMVIGASKMPGAPSPRALAAAGWGLVAAASGGTARLGPAWPQNSPGAVFLLRR
ncbi:MAG: glycosyltransferase family 39 protein [Pseudomonadota bacterium]|nr:glycosyltransferase family 39 protein [Pseudomonadota bacterium]